MVAQCAQSVVPATELSHTKLQNNVLPVLKIASGNKFYSDILRARHFPLHPHILTVVGAVIKSVLRLFTMHAQHHMISELATALALNPRPITCSAADVETSHYSTCLAFRSYNNGSPLGVILTRVMKTYQNI